MTRVASLILAAIMVLLVGCSSDDFRDLDEFMAEKRVRPAGVIAPIPAFKDYQAFAYSATTIRSPFERPLAVREVAQLQSIATVRPHPERPKEFLEQFELESLLMVGTMQRGGKNWTLVQDPEGGIHRVGVSNYLGRNHGRVVEMAPTFLSVIEIVSDGSEGGWVERPRTIMLASLQGAEES